MMSFLVTLMFFSGLMVYCSKRKHLLMMLLSLEFIVLSLYLGIFCYLDFLGYEHFFSMIFLTMAVCEGALGLSLLVLMMRSCGNDYVMTFSFLW